MHTTPLFLRYPGQIERQLRLMPVWIDEELHAAALSALFAAGRRKLSLFDCASFEVMRRYRLRVALALDPDFARQGFGLLPEV